MCLSCRTHLSAHDSIISKAFQGRHGRAYLFADVVNINSGPTENRLLLTGLHVVDHVETKAGMAGRQGQSAEAGRGGLGWGRPELELALVGRRATCPKPVSPCSPPKVVADIYCNACDTRLGWKYVEAFEESQKYKEGRFILEKAMIIKEEELRRRSAEEAARLSRRQEAAEAAEEAEEAEEEAEVTDSDAERRESESQGEAEGEAEEAELASSDASDMQVENEIDHEIDQPDHRP